MAIQDATPDAMQEGRAAVGPRPTIALLQSSSLTGLVQAELERLILSGELVPGERLPEVALAARLGVSRGPLREAFRMLEEAGLVRTEKNRGVQVRDVPLDEAIEIFDLRAAMDELVGASSRSRSRGCSSRRSARRSTRWSAPSRRATPAATT